MNLIKELSLKFGIYKENKKIGKMLKDMEKQSKLNPDFKNQEVSEENKKTTIDALENLIKYKSLLGKNCSQEQNFLIQLKK